MVKLGTIRFKGRCDRHPGFEPIEGVGAIRGGCRRCQRLLDIYLAHARLVELIREARNEASESLPKKTAPLVDKRQGALF